MTDNKDDKTLGVKKTLTLKPSGVSQGTVRQDMGRGRTKAVVVETRKRRPIRPEDDKPAFTAPTPRAAEPAAPAPRPQQPNPPATRVHQPTQAQRPAAPAPQQRQGERPRGAVLHDLSASEMDARRRALVEAQAREVIEAKQRAEDEARRQAEEERRKLQEAEEAARRAAEPAPVEVPVEEAPAPAATPAPAERAADARPGISRTQPAAPAQPVIGRGRKAGNEEDDDRGPPRGAPVRGRVAAPAPAKAPARPKTEDERRRGKLTVTTVSTDDDGGNARGRSMAAMRRRQEKFRRSQMQEPREKVMREVTLPETITIQELSQRMSERAVDVIKFLMKEGQMMKPGDVIDADLAELIAVEFGHTVKRVSESDVEEGIFDVADEEGVLEPRPPVVTIMGHVDHGKTSLLDAIRQANVVAGEAGGITQHIGAYQVEQNGQKITFIDTPGHAAFTAMRARGAQATDIAILVVAADDSVMPQTIESINHAKAAGVPIIVAINKIDKPTANAQKVRTELLQHEVFVESMGGEVLDVEVSAKNKTNLDKLLEAILLQAEILDLKANPNRTAEGTVIEAQLDRGRGAVATVLVQKGTLKPGQILVAGDQWGRVRALVTDKGEHVKEAGPAMPVEVLGLSGTPAAGAPLAGGRPPRRRRAATPRTLGSGARTTR